MMKRTVLLSLAGAVVLAASVTTAAVVFQDDDVTVSAVCVPIMDTDRDKAGIADNVAVVTAREQSEAARGSDGEQRVTVQVRVDEVLKGSLPKTLPIDQTAGDTARPEVEQQPLVPGHRYVLGVPNAQPENGAPGPGRWAFFATSADGAQLETVRKRWTDAIAHQNPKRIDPACEDTTYTP
ncbi:hypothetical protein ABT117_16640 [Streptomyces sp. NPDC002262]|uniref:hypothetical protein n=1 Tax=Streptomyces sp. NPDC002262 TaxID=3154414 RepID=UPI003322719A